LIERTERHTALLRVEHDDIAEVEDVEVHALVLVDPERARMARDLAAALRTA
jgi:hypothetical protein